MTIIQKAVFAQVLIGKKVQDKPNTSYIEGCNMSKSTWKPPLWHFAIICLLSYNVCKDDNFTIF